MIKYNGKDYEANFLRYGNTGILSFAIDITLPNGDLLYGEVHYSSYGFVGDTTTVSFAFGTLPNIFHSTDSTIYATAHFLDYEDLIFKARVPGIYGQQITTKLYVTIIGKVE